jgi:hypothetical protein
MTGTFRWAVFLLSAFLFGSTGGYLGFRLAELRPVSGDLSSKSITVRASRFELIDDSGRVLATLASSPEAGTANLSFYDDKGRLRETVGMQAGERDLSFPKRWLGYRPVIEFFGEDGHSRFNIALDRWDKPLMAMGAPDSEAQIVLGHGSMNDEGMVSDTPVWMIGLQAPDKTAVAKMGTINSLAGKQAKAFLEIKDQQHQWHSRDAKGRP